MVPESIILLAPLRTTRSADLDVPGDLVVRPCAASDAVALGTVYFDACDSGVAGGSVDEAIAGMEKSFRGDYGDLWEEASPLGQRAGEILAAVITLRRAAWNGTPDCPFIFEVFTARTYRRQGIARHLVTLCMRTARDARESAIALQVLTDNGPAMGLYESLGFKPWSPG